MHAFLDGFLIVMRPLYAPAILCFSLLLCGDRAAAQPVCEPSWQTTLGTQPYSDYTVSAVFAGRIEGLSDGADVAIVARNHRIFVCRNSTWSPLGVMDDVVAALTVYDPDGNGPLPGYLIAGGGFIRADGVAANHVARWDGAAWVPLGGGISGGVASLTVFDPDGDGPLNPQLIAGGSFSSAGGVPASGVARWNGSTWSALSSGSMGPVTALTTYDGDGAGPLPPILVAGGNFTVAGGNVPANYVAGWNGNVWSPLSSGTNGSVGTLAQYDADGAGPLPPRLYAGGSFTTAGGSPALYVASWDGTAWSPLGAGTNGYVGALTTYDSDGGGPGPVLLIAAGAFATAGAQPSRGIAAWNGLAWSNFSGGINGSITGIASFDPDGPGPQTPHLIVGGNTSQAGSVSFNCVARWNGTAWRPPGDGISDPVQALTTHDFDGDGPAPAQLVAAGIFRGAGTTDARYIARRDGDSWIPLGGGRPNHVYALASYDADGDGPLSASLVAGGLYTVVDAPNINRIAQWNGVTWSTLGSGITGSTHALTVYDPDGTGPLAPQLIAGGFFSAAGGTPANNIARWNGSAWSALGSGVNGLVEALTVYDPDGDGPLTPQLIAGGSFTSAGGSPANRIARWNGTAWSTLGDGLGHTINETVFALTVYDPDGAGPLQTRLIAGGQFETAGNVNARYIAQWDGTAWTPFGDAINDQVRAIAVFDPDDDGPAPAQLYIGGDFDGPGGAARDGIMRWDGTAWRDRGTVSADVRVFTLLDPDGPGPRSTQLIAAGAFFSVGGLQTSNIALYGCPIPGGPEPCGPADVASTGGVAAPDGTLDNNDFVVFIEYFFSQNPAADAGSTGGVPGSDGIFDNNDFVIFIDQFFTGC